jgi:hypothetical protein
MLDAPIAGHEGFRPLSPGRPKHLSSAYYISACIRTLRIGSVPHVQPFAILRYGLLWRRLTSACPSGGLATVLALRSASLRGTSCSLPSKGHASLRGPGLYLRLAQSPASREQLNADRQISQGKARDLHPIPAAYTSLGPDDFGLWIPTTPHPPQKCLVCDSCSSGRGFASSFLPTSPREDAVAVRLGVPVIKASRGLSPPSHFPYRFRSLVDSARHGAARHAWRT